MPGHYMHSSLMAAIQAEQFELANLVSEEYAGHATAETAEAAIRHLGQALELVRVVRSHLAVRAASTFRQSVYESTTRVAGRWTLEA